MSQDVEIKDVRKARARARRCARGDCGCQAAAEHGTYCGEHCAKRDRVELVPEHCDCGHEGCHKRRSASEDSL